MSRVNLSAQEKSQRRTRWELPQDIITTLTTTKTWNTHCYYKRWQLLMWGITTATTKCMKQANNWGKQCLFCQFHHIKRIHTCYCYCTITSAQSTHCQPVTMRNYQRPASFIPPTDRLINTAELSVKKKNSFIYTALYIIIPIISKQLHSNKQENSRCCKVQQLWNNFKNSSTEDNSVTIQLKSVEVLLFSAEQCQYSQMDK